MSKARWALAIVCLSMFALGLAWIRAQSSTRAAWDPNCRIGVAAPQGVAGFEDRIDDLGVCALLTFSDTRPPTLSSEIEFVHVIRVKDPPDLVAISNLIISNPGAIWEVGNEPDTCYEVQDCVDPEIYAQRFYDIANRIRADDLTASIGFGTLVQPTPVRLRYLERAWLKLVELAGGDPLIASSLIDFWNVHAFILNEWPGEWGTGVPLGFDCETSNPGSPNYGKCWDQGAATDCLVEPAKCWTIVHYTNHPFTETHDNAIFNQRIRDLRQWMADMGEREKPLWITEYGSLFPPVDPPGGPDLVNVSDTETARYMTESFDFILNTTDNTTGYPDDGDHLVQRWFWYSLNDRRYTFGGTLYDPDNCGVRTVVGDAFVGYLQSLSPAPTIFEDVPPDHWARLYIEDLYNSGYIAGCWADPLRYCPENTMTRAESAVFVERGIHGGGYLPLTPMVQVFEDVPLDQWYAKWANALWEDGYTAGCWSDPLRYCPLQDHTRAEGAVFYLRMLNGPDYIPPTPAIQIFADVPIDQWYAKWVHKAYEQCLIPACETSPDLKFCPFGDFSRSMGAFAMVQAKGGYPLPTPTPTPTATPTSDVAGLIAAINAANANGPDMDIINLTFGTYTLMDAYSGENGLPAIASEIVINGNGSVIERDNAAPPFRLFEVHAGGNLTLDNLIIRGGQTHTVGGGLYINGGTVSIFNSTISDNSAPDAPTPNGHGGGIYNTGTLTIVDSILTGNMAGRLGGGIHNIDGILTISNSTISNNNAGVGGGVVILSGTATISDSTFSGNTANMGGALENHGALDISGSTLSNNTSLGSGRGGGIKNHGILNLTSSILFGNIGGGIYNYNVGTTTVTDTCILGNTPTSFGSVIYNGDPMALSATSNWWGAADGPSGAGPGSGDSVSPNVVFTPFLTSSLPGCPTDPTITAVIATHSGVEVYPGGPAYISPNSTISLSATVYGANGFNRAVTWSIVSGGGSLSDSTGDSVIFTASSSTGNSVVRATAAGDASKFAEVTIRTADISVLATRAEATVLTGGSVPLLALVKVDGDNDYEQTHLTWQIISGSGSLANTPGNRVDVTFTSSDSPGISVIRVSSVADPSKFADITITINVDGPYTCSNPPVISSGEVTYYVSTGGLQDNWPDVSKFVISEFDPLIGEPQTVTITARVMSPATEPIQSVTVTLISDTGEYGPYDFALISGTETEGDWRGSWVIEDTHCGTYLMRIAVTNAVHTWGGTMTFR